MYKGIVEHRVSPRAPFKTEIIISFLDEAQNAVIAKTIDISAGGIQFFAPFGQKFLNEGDPVKLLFNLPLYGKTDIEAVVKYHRLGIDTDCSRIIYYGAKFTNLTIDTWNAILDFSRMSIETVSPQARYYHDRNDIRINAGVPSKVYLEDNCYYSCTIDDISFGGAKLRLSTSIPKNVPVNLLILDPEAPFEIDGLSAWTEPSENEAEFLTGVFFNPLDSEKYRQLRAYIFKLVAERENG